jgi:hypothetical protein
MARSSKLDKPNLGEAAVGLEPHEVALHISVELE